MKQTTDSPASVAPQPPGPTGRFGTFGGVFTPSILTILGVIMYLRMGWVVGNSGLAGALIIVGVSHVISFATGFSIASISTNRTVGAGGAYFMISRSLGAPAGAAIGIPLFLGQALSVTFYVVGFTESLTQLNPAIDPRLAGTITVVTLTLVSLKSTDLALKVQYFVMAAIALSLGSFFLGGSPAPPAHIEWWNAEGAGFSEVFSVFFPAVTGIMAGVSMSGDLRNPRKSLPLGTLTAILVGMAIYVSFPIWLALNANNQTLLTNLDIVWTVSRIPALIYVGIWGATLSSALGSILAAPRTLQALAVDRMVFPVFAKGHGPGNEPRLGLIATFALAEVGILLGNLDLIAPILTMFFLATYGVTNLAFGLEKWAANPSFRPTFQVPAWVGLGGAAACFYVMSVINLGAMVAALSICSGIFFLAQRRALDTTYGDARHGIWSALVLTALQRLRRIEYHELNWRPNLIILAGDLNKRHHLLELGSAIVQDRGMVTYLHILKGDVREEADNRRRWLEILDRRFAIDHPNVFCSVDIDDDVYRGAVSSVQSHGFGTVETNTVMLGWITKRDRILSYSRMLQELRALDKSLLVVRQNAERGFGEGRRIDIWWRGLQSNGAMMLLLAFLLTSSDRFSEAQVRVLTAVDTERRRDEAEARLAEILRRTRLDATPRVLLQGSRRIDEVMKEESQGSDLLLIGLRIPEGNESAEAFMEGYTRILTGMPTSILVASAPSFVGTAALFDGA